MWQIAALLYFIAPGLIATVVFLEEQANEAVALCVHLGLRP
jgi:hypothetical protein